MRRAFTATIVGAVVLLAVIALASISPVIAGLALLAVLAALIGDVVVDEYKRIRSL